MIREQLFIYLLNNDQEFRETIVGEASAYAAALFSAANEFGKEPEKTSAGIVKIPIKRHRRPQLKFFKEKVLKALQSRKEGLTPKELLSYINKDHKDIIIKDIYNITEALKKTGKITSFKAGNRVTYLSN